MAQPKKTLLVLGGSSDIGCATALSFASRGWAIQLAGRDIEAIQREANHVALNSGTEISTHHLDILDTKSFSTFVDTLPGLPDAVVSVIGYLGEQPLAETDLAHATKIIRTNYEGPALMLGLFAERFLARGSGIIIGVSSVAGDRGRASNYVYGSAKAGLTAFLSGLRSRSSKSNVQVITVKPGFVRTRMTEGLKLPPVLTVMPHKVGEAIVNAVENSRDVVYVSRLWFVIMTIIRTIPEFIFKKLSI